LRDLTKPCRMGWELPMDRVPSDSDARTAFVIGHWCHLRDWEPRRLEAQADPLLGEMYRLEARTAEEGAGPVVAWLQCWPHPQNAGQTLVVVASWKPEDAGRG
jgi:hypothetical protein